PFHQTVNRVKAKNKLFFCFGTSGFCSYRFRKPSHSLYTDEKPECPLPCRLPVQAGGIKLGVVL
ncbi:hypothetical protein, partial [Pedobacter psychrodurus]|uniref:hypothetical protein n=1 Tax=Pedobacter psychrodurus TaxID=2530456 RepID=UPI00292E8B5F